MRNLESFAYGAILPSNSAIAGEGDQFIESFDFKDFTKKSDNMIIEEKPGADSLSAAQLNAAGASKNSAAPADTEHKVKLVASQYDAPEYGGSQPSVGYIASPLSYRIVEFDNMPSITESNTVQYEPIAPPHMPMAFQKYKGTDSVTYSIDALFTARNTAEAYRNYVFCMNLRAWTKPFFGNKQKNADGSRGKLGAPPPVLKFSGYRGSLDVPVVITKLDIPKPNDCDWINTGYNNIPFPTVLKVTISLTEIYSGDQINAFDLNIFRVGGGSPSSPASPNSTPSPTTSGVKDPTSTGRGAIETPNERWNHLYGAELKPWEIGKPEYK
jgi:hypothetical protein